ncbi:NRPS-like enzyme [Penicillium waksmanii]|uniref:NRPS-like enzyme n=1 Tax=Penicillium waksmanii TaxID=69791 RepID=UPI0025478A58|nr:NRPS-like enzyme [Penicillium waksmanii]KAJ5995378.1 NRPS-like enzyme [Penicillium waksmanii]
MDTKPRLLANVIETKAKTIPDAPWLLYAKSSSWEHEGGYKTITWKQCANAINKMAHFLDENIPRQSKARQTITYQGPNDARYYIMMVAAAKSKRTVFIPDGRITPDGMLKILDEIKCKIWVSPDDQGAFPKGQTSLKIPSLEDILEQPNSGDIQYTYDESWEQEKNEIVCIIHTSGTTGNPKPIYLRNGFMSVFDWILLYERHLSPKITYHHYENSLTLTTCAPQWLGGFAFTLNTAAFVGMITVLLPPDMKSPLDRESVIRICRHTGAKSIVTPPSLIEDFYNDESAFEFLKSLDYVCWLGAGLDSAIGDDLARHTHLFPVIGSTERGPQPSFEPRDAKMWNTFEFIPESGPRFEKISDDLYELQIGRTPEHDFFQGGFYVFPDLDTIPSSEIYSPVVDSYGSTRWTFRGRTGDLVKLSWLAKFHATHIESAINKHSQVNSVVMGGEGRDVPYIIVEPKDHNEIQDHKRFIDEIYDAMILSLNEKGHQEIQIPRETVMLSDPSLPFQRTLKMTIIRQKVEDSYKQHIDAMYQLWQSKKGKQAPGQP